jgi:hypothetical protein
MCGVTADIPDCHRVERLPGHTQTPQLPVASPCVALNTSVVSCQALLLWTYRRTGVLIITKTLEICSSDMGTYSRAMEHIREKGNAYENYPEILRESSTCANLAQLRV